MKEGLGVADVKLIQGTGGVFDVRADGKLVFSKAETGRFPEPGEVLKLVKEEQDAETSEEEP